VCLCVIVSVFVFCCEHVLVYCCECVCVFTFGPGSMRGSRDLDLTPSDSFTRLKKSVSTKIPYKVKFIIESLH